MARPDAGNQPDNGTKPEISKELEKGARAMVGCSRLLGQIAAIQGVSPLHVDHDVALCQEPRLLSRTIALLQNFRDWDVLLCC